MFVLRNKFQASGCTCWIVFEQDAVVLAWTPRKNRKHKPLSVLNGLWVHCLRCKLRSKSDRDETGHAEKKLIWLPCVASGDVKTNISAKPVTLVTDKRREFAYLNEQRTALRKHEVGDWNFQVLQWTRMTKLTNHYSAVTPALPTLGSHEAVSACQRIHTGLGASAF